MTSIVPDLDTTDFDQLVLEGQALIPAYAPDWTDHNLHDPGITLIDLIAYLADQQIYRIGFVGDSLMGAFTRLMGVVPREPEPARVLIWPQLDGVGVFDFEAGTEIDTPDVDGARWTLDASIRTVEPIIAGISTVTGDARKSVGIGLTEGRDPLPLPAFQGGGPRALEITLSKPIIALADDGYVSLGCLFAEPAPDDGPTWGPVKLDQWHEDGYWRALDLIDLTGGLRHDGVLLFKTRDDGASDRFRIRLDAGFRPGPVTLTRLGLNVLPATEGWDSPQGWDFEDTELPDGTGLPDQLVPFRSDTLVEKGHLLKPLDPDPRPLKIVTFAGQDVRTWTQVSTFDLSGPHDAHYMRTAAGILFGNGLNGRLVPREAQIRHRPLRRSCGAEGAVTTGLNWRISGVVYGTNYTASTAGRDRDGLTELLHAARKVAVERTGRLRSDIIAEGLAAADLGLERIDVRPRARPGRSGLAVNGNRTVLILPKRDPTLAPPVPDGELSARTAALLEPGRLLGERLHVSPPRYRYIDVALDLLVEADAPLSTVQARAEDLLRQRLWDLPRQSEPVIDPWPPGRPVTVGEIQTLMTSLEAVIAVPDCKIAVAGEPLSDATIHLDDREIALARHVTITTRRNVEGGTP